MANFEKQPRELLHMVLRHLSREDLSALSCTSKQYRSLVEPTLYREICWTNANRRPWSQLPVHLLLRSLLSRPELASHIHFLAMCCKKTHIWIRKKTPYFMSTELERIKSLISSFHFTAEKVWISALHRGDLDLFIALLISQSTNLRRLHLFKDYLMNTRFIGAILENAVAANSLCCLEHVQYGEDVPSADGFAPYDSIGYCQVGPLFSISTMKSIRMSLLNLDILWLGPNVPVSGLKSLVLHHSQVSEEDLGKLLLATPSLKSLEYQPWISVNEFPPSPKQRWEYFDCTQLSYSLAHLQGSLERLFISIHFFSKRRPNIGIDGWKFRGVSGKLKTLRDFDKLSSLTIPTTLLSDWTPDMERFHRLQDVPSRLANLLPTSTLEYILISDDLSELVVRGDRSADNSPEIDWMLDEGHDVPVDIPADRMDALRFLQ